jgi:hypothetical protein
MRILLSRQAGSSGAEGTLKFTKTTAFTAVPAVYKKYLSDASTKPMP